MFVSFLFQAFTGTFSVYLAGEAAILTDDLAGLLYFATYPKKVPKHTADHEALQIHKASQKFVFHSRKYQKMPHKGLLL